MDESVQQPAGSTVRTRSPHACTDTVEHGGRCTHSQAAEAIRRSEGTDVTGCLSFHLLQILLHGSVELQLKLHHILSPIPHSTRPHERPEARRRMMDTAGVQTDARMSARIRQLDNSTWWALKMVRT